MRYCTKCGAPLEPNAKFCTRCGNLVTADPSAPLRPVTATTPPAYQSPARGVPSAAAALQAVTKDLRAVKTPGEMVLGTWSVVDVATQAVQKMQNAPVKKKGRRLKIILGIVIFLAICYLIGQFG